jgi:penicillin-binding protein 1A
MADFRTLPDQKPLNPWADRFEKHSAWTKWIRRIFIGGMAVLLLSIVVFSLLTPSFKKLEDPTMYLASEVIAQDDSTVLGRLYIQNRAPVKFENLPKNIVQALIATEDSRFNEHSGIDYEALSRVLVKTFLMGQSGQGGGSTLTMQLAKLLYSDRDFKDMNFVEKLFGYYYRKLSEMITAVKLERAYTKEEIITMYLNTYDFGYNAHGIRAASEVYFSKAPEQLSFEESATLVGMCNNSALYNPIRRNERTKQRRNKVLERCYEQHILNERQYRELVAKPLDVSKFKTRSHNDGLATYFRTTLADDAKKMLKERGVVKSDGTEYDIYRDGLKVYTSLDAEMQNLAEASMREHMATLQAKYFKVWKGRDPWAYRDAETTDAQILQRQASLETQIRNSDRFWLLRGKYLEGSLGFIEEEFEGFNLTDNDILNMLRQEKQANFLDAMVKGNNLNAKRAETYRNIMKNTNWAKVKVQWNKLQAEAKNDFNIPVKMKVFAYNLVGEKDTTLTPLDSIRYHRMHLQLGSMGVDPLTGYVKFWVGGIGHKYFQVDHVRVDRQVGSTFKPFIYATAIAQFGVSPCQQVHDVAQTISPGEGSFGLMQSWTPKNSGGYSGGYMTLWDALKESRNTASVYLMKSIGSTQPVREVVHEMGIDVDAKLSNGQFRLPKTPAICLGAADLTVMEMTGGYCTFANNGIYTKPQYIRKIADKTGRIIYQSISKTQGALPENAAYVMLQMLKYNVRGATGIKTLKSEVGGKTGTTNDFRDGWFMGVTPRLVVGTWVGGEDQWIRFLRIEDGQGGAMARPFFAKFLDKVEHSKTAQYNVEDKFKKPAGDLGITLNCGDYYDNGSRNTEGGTPAFNPNGFQDEEQGNTKPAAADPNALSPATGAATPAKPALPIKPTTPAKPPVGLPKVSPATKPKADDGFQQ